MKCQHCSKEEVLPFKCQYCQGLLCAEHRLPESHDCSQIEKARAPRPEAPPFEYKITYTPPRPFAKFGFSQKEIIHLAISAVLVIGVGFSIIMGSRQVDLFKSPMVLLAASFMFVGLFLFHEIAHKLVAHHYGLWAEFRLILFGVFLTLLSIIPFSFKIIAPGAVMIAGHASREVIGKTAVAGPLTNIVLSFVSLPVAFLVPSAALVAYWSVAFNAGIALFNTIPFGMLDGLKIYEWNKIVWATVFTLALALTIVTFIGL